jgi:hypothetical protein
MRPPPGTVCFQAGTMTIYVTDMMAHNCYID